MFKFITSKIADSLGIITTTRVQNPWEQTLEGQNMLSFRVTKEEADGLHDDLVAEFKSGFLTKQKCSLLIQVLDLARNNNLTKEYISNLSHEFSDYTAQEVNDAIIEMGGYF